jgi:subtilisin family serine protease
MPAWRLAEEAYLEEFGETPALDRPALLTLVITDGEARDAAEFTKVLEQAKTGRYFCVAVIGYGSDHDQTLNAYQNVAAVNPHVRVVTFGGETNPQTIAEGLISLVG